MTTRRSFLLTGTGALVGSSLLQACSGADERDYTLAASEAHRTFSGPFATPGAMQRELVRYATMASSSHNTQCWKFRLGDGVIAILPDTARRCPAVDPDDHHLYVSLGCAAENMLQAAAAMGLHAEAHFDAQLDELRISFDKSPIAPVRSALFEAIPLRQCTRSDYDGKALMPDELRLLEKAGTGDGVRLMLFSARQQMEQVLEYVTRANTAQMADPAFMDELRLWIRFNPQDALASGDGLYSATTGNPALPHWLGPLMMSLMFRSKSENDKYAKQVRSSAGIAVFVSEVSDKAHWIETGSCYERFALQATALGIRNAMLNQPVEVTALRPQFASFLGLPAGRPDLVVRFGRGPTMPRSLRRPLDTVLV